MLSRICSDEIASHLKIRLVVSCRHNPANGYHAVDSFQFIWIMCSEKASNIIIFGEEKKYINVKMLLCKSLFATDNADKMCGNFSDSTKYWQVTQFFQNSFVKNDLPWKSITHSRVEETRVYGACKFEIEVNVTGVEQLRNQPNVKKTRSQWQWLVAKLCANSQKANLMRINRPDRR